MAREVRVFRVGRIGKGAGLGLGLSLLFLVSLLLPFLPALLRRRWPRFFKVHGYAFAFLVLTFLFTYATLPFEKIKAKYLRLAEAKLGMDIVGKFEKSWFTGIAGRNVRLIPRSRPGEKVKEMEIEEVVARLALLPLFLGRIRFDVSAKVGGGEVEGSFALRGDGNEIEARLENVDLKDLTLLHRIAGRSFGGTVSGNASLLLARNIGASSGKLDLTVDGVRVDAFQVPVAQWGNQPFTVPALTLGTLRAQIDVQDGAAVFQEFRFQNSPDLEASVEGYAVLQDALRFTHLRAYLRFRFTDAFYQRNPKFRVLEDAIRAARRSDGAYGFLLEGPLGDPRRLQRTPMPRPPPNLTPPARGAAGPAPAVAAPRRPGDRPELEAIQRRLGK